MSDAQLSMPILGLSPFVLVEMTDAKLDGDNVDISLNVEIGGGLDLGTGIELLKMAVEELENRIG
ncbi:hypothetical protein [Micromonospora sp. CB01531]|uniref:hypothetical protein n=1 Tax=Micromonospora sp. CB01531 TaxID=1718947 RepID=UPI00093FA4A1|nr:hypothetical protein [Micromonospora sp. CB01531]OKI54547.1 hypothetical protein A6A27_31980 [Micromonospora sp. CB01531]